MYASLAVLDMNEARLYLLVIRGILTCCGVIQAMPCVSIFRISCFHRFSSEKKPLTPLSYASSQMHLQCCIFVLVLFVDRMSHCDCKPRVFDGQVDKSVVAHHGVSQLRLIINRILRQSRVGRRICPCRIILALHPLSLSKSRAGGQSKLQLISDRVPAVTNDPGVMIRRCPSETSIPIFSLAEDRLSSMAPS